MSDSMDYTILICDDDEDILSALQIYLTQDGYRVILAANGCEAVERVKQETVHLVLLDIMMPVMDGIQAAVEIRKLSNVPILFLSAKSEDTDRVFGLTMGGDDYITKPFNPVELLARVKAALRRYARLGGLSDSLQAQGQARQGQAGVGQTWQAGVGQAGQVWQAQGQAGVGQAGQVWQAQGQGQTPQAGSLFQTGGLILDDIQKRVTLDNEEVQLTALEYNILRLLMSSMDRVFSSTQIYEAVWDEPALQVPKTVSVHIRHIREKIEINPKEPQYLKVIYGLGYKVVKLA